MEHRPGRLGPALEGAVDALWYLRMERRHATEQILPLPSVEVIVVLGAPYRLLEADGTTVEQEVPPVFTTGLRRGPVRIANPSVIEHVAVQLPVHGLARFAVPPAGRVRGLTGPLGQGLEELRAVSQAEQPDPDVLLTRAALALETCLVPETPAQGLVRRAVDLLRAEPTRPVGGVAAEVGVSHQRLIAHFHRYVGRPPKWVARLFLVHRFLEQVPGEGPVPSWTELVADSPYADQSHFIRSFTRMTGLTPRAYLAGRAGSGYGDARFLGGEG
jgi:AraC-like DNA-binding protein